MERDVFARRLEEAAAAARDFAGKFLAEPLPEPVLFRIAMNSSYDGNPLVGDERLYPEDGSFERARAESSCTYDQVVDGLWRDGRVPEWIDVGVVVENGTATILKLECCGRFTAQDDALSPAVWSVAISGRRSVTPGRLRGTALQHLRPVRVSEPPRIMVNGDEGDRSWQRHLPMTDEPLRSSADRCRIHVASAR